MSLVPVAKCLHVYYAHSIVVHSNCIITKGDSVMHFLSAFDYTL